MPCLRCARAIVSHWRSSRRGETIGRSFRELVTASDKRGERTAPVLRRDRSSGRRERKHRSEALCCGAARLDVQLRDLSDLNRGRKSAPALRRSCAEARETGAREAEHRDSSVRSY